MGWFFIYEEVVLFRRCPKARFEWKAGSWFSNGGYQFSDGKWEWKPFSEERYRTLLEQQKETPTSFAKINEEGKRFWMFQDNFYMEDEGLTEVEVKALILETENKKKKRIQKAVSLMEQVKDMPNEKRETIPENVKIYVWRRDEGKCVKCGSQKNLEYDHDIPVSKGGGNTARNIRILCERCNREKKDNII